VADIRCPLSASGTRGIVILLFPVGRVLPLVYYAQTAAEFNSATAPFLMRRARAPRPRLTARRYSWSRCWIWERAV